MSGKTSATPPEAGEPLPPTLYHYTTAEGLYAMLQSGHVWATDCFYLNDPNELRYGFDLLRAVAEKMLARRKSPELSQFLFNLPLIVRDKVERGRIYVMSFTSEGDLLSQWRGYGATSGGYAVGFVPNRLLGRTKYEKEPYRVLRQVIYKRRMQERIVRDGLSVKCCTSPLSTQSMRFYFCSRITS